MCKYCDFPVDSNSAYIDATDTSCSDGGFSVGLHHSNFAKDCGYYIFGEYYPYEDETIDSDLANSFSTRNGYSLAINFCPFCGRKLNVN